jgi:hypothetical protein
MRDNYVLIYDGKEWQLKDRDLIINDMLDNGSFILEEKFEKLLNQLDEFTVKKFRRFLSLKDENRVIINIKNDLKLLLYNKRKMTEETKNKVANKLIENKI